MERVGFEPTVPVTEQPLSRRPPSATQPPLQLRYYNYLQQHQLKYYSKKNIRSTCSCWMLFFNAAETLKIACWGRGSFLCFFSNDKFARIVFGL